MGSACPVEGRTRSRRTLRVVPSLMSSACAENGCIHGNYAGAFVVLLIVAIIHEFLLSHDKLLAVQITISGAGMRKTDERELIIKLRGLCPILCS